MLSYFFSYCLVRAFFIAQFFYIVSFFRDCEVSYSLRFSFHIVILFFSQSVFGLLMFSKYTHENIFLEKPVSSSRKYLLYVTLMRLYLSKDKPYQVSTVSYIIQSLWWNTRICFKVLWFTFTDERVCSSLFFESLPCCYIVKLILYIGRCKKALWGKT